MTASTNPQKPNTFFLLLVGLILILLVGLIDYLTGAEMEFSVFYLLPIFVVTWYAGSLYGLLAAIVSTVVYYAVDILSGSEYSKPFIAYWNAAIPLAIFLIVTLLLAALKRAYARGRKLSLTDNLTGAIDTRSFSELATQEIERARVNRQPLTVAYLDLDALRSVNDSLGKSVGDKVLSSVVKQAQRELRDADTIARLGGDEFAILMPVFDQEDAKEAVGRVQARLLKEMKKKKWPITFTIVVLTCYKIPQSSDELIKRLEDLMATAKQAGKDSVTYVLNGEAPVAAPAAVPEVAPAVPVAEAAQEVKQALPEGEAEQKQ